MNLIAYLSGLILIGFISGFALRGVSDRDRIWSYWIGFSQALLILLLTALVE